MGIRESYKSLDCYKNLRSDHQNCLCRLAEVYGNQLNGLIQSGGSLFTLHDFDHHCYDLYRIVSNCLCNVDTADEDHRKFSEHELFLLDLAILFHDIGMSSRVNLVINRAEHANRSAEFIRAEWGNRGSPLYIYGSEAGLSENDITALAEIIRAHSDDKNADDPTKTGIYAPRLLEQMPSSAPSGTVRAKFLAGILRMADELDITNERQGDASLSEQLDFSNEDNRFSKECWEKLTYFSHVEVDQKVCDQLNLVINEGNVRERIELSDEDTVLTGILNVYQKVKKEWESIQTEVFQRTKGARTIIRVETIELASAVPEVVSYISDKLEARKNLMPLPQGKEIHRLSPVEKPEEQPGSEGLPPCGGQDQARNSSSTPSEDNQAASTPKGKKDSGNRPISLAPALKDEIDDLIRDKRLVTPGHFLMHNNLCARDWINVSGLLSRSDLLESCVKTIARHIKNNDQIDLAKTVILGIDLNGTLLGVRIAAALRCPFMLLVPPQGEKSSGGRDRETELSAYAYAVCITDVIATGATINEVAKRRDLHNKLLCAYSMLYRPPQYTNSARTSKLPCPVYCISDTFNIEVVDSKSCQWKENGSCLDCNRIIQ